MRALAALMSVPLTGEELAFACQQVEHRVVGAPCGIMDQMTSACGQEGALLSLLCQPDRIEGTILLPDTYACGGLIRACNIMSAEPIMVVFAVLLSWA